MEDEARRTHVADYLDKNGRSVLVSNVPMKVIMRRNDNLSSLGVATLCNDNLSMDIGKKKYILCLSLF